MTGFLMRRLPVSIPTLLVIMPVAFFMIRAAPGGRFDQERARRRGKAPDDHRRHIIPNVMGPVIVYVTLTVRQAILIESFLSFSASASGAAHVPACAHQRGAQQMESAPWMLISPATFLAVTLFCFNFIGDGVRDALDPGDG